MGLYQEYKDKGFNIVGISSDAAANDWKASIEKDDLPWVNLRDPEGRESTVQYQYGIHLIPTNFLIGPEGTIVAKNIPRKSLSSCWKTIYRNNRLTISNAEFHSILFPISDYIYSSNLQFRTLEKGENEIIVFT